MPGEPSLGEGSSYIGRAYSLLFDKTVEGQNVQRLSDYIDSFSSTQFLSAADPPAWLNGQCVAWARRLYGRVANTSLDGINFGLARNIPSVLAARGFEVVTDQGSPRVGSLIVWDDGGAGHVGVVVAVDRDSKSGNPKRVRISEANFGRITRSGARRWGLTEVQARREFVTDKYGEFDEVWIDLAKPSRGIYEFLAYVYP